MMGKWEDDWRDMEGRLVRYLATDGWHVRSISESGDKVAEKSTDKISPLVEINLTEMAKELVS